MPKNLETGKKPYLCTAFEQSTGLWCNGNTADSGPAFPGSSPGSPAKRRDAIAPLLFYFGGLRPLSLAYSLRPNTFEPAFFRFQRLQKHLLG